MSEIQQQEHKDDHSTLSSAEFKNDGSHTSTPPTCLHGVHRQGQLSCRLSVPLGKYRELTISWVIQELCFNAYITMRQIRLEENHGEYIRIREKTIKVNV